MGVHGSAQVEFEMLARSAPVTVKRHCRQVRRQAGVDAAAQRRSGAAAQRTYESGTLEYQSS